MKSKKKEYIIFMLVFGIIGFFISYLIFGSVNVSLFGVGTEIDVSLSYIILGLGADTGSGMIDEAFNSVANAAVSIVRQKIWTGAFIGAFIGGFISFLKK